MMNAGESVPNAFWMSEKCVDENTAKSVVTEKQSFALLLSLSHTYHNDKKSHC